MYHDCFNQPSSHKSASKSVGQPANQSVIQPASQQTQSVIQFVSRPVSHIASELENQLVNRSDFDFQLIRRTCTPWIISFKGSQTSRAFTEKKNMSY
jgi:hypothetical protein